ncbi:uncharacterized protein LOC134909731 [Pseudophryne corroboree]|uniref:uncharacterized protein LOC134909731 n=1 Tax=Pseudophryne corroboree TaxID=495146 RepID=UPI003081FB01
MGRLTQIVDFLKKQIGVSSNQLLKCVLLNSAIELFSYIDAPTYSGSVYQYHDWNIEDLDHLCSKFYDTGPVTKLPDVLITSLPSDGVTEQADVLISKDTVNSTHKLETALPVSETLHLVCPVDLLLELPFCFEEVATTENIYLLCACDLQVLPAITVLNCSTTGNKDVTTNAYGVTDDLITSDIINLSSLQTDAFFGSFNNEDEMEDKSVFWDSYDMHVSRSPFNCQYTNMPGGWNSQTKEICTFEDARIMGDEAAASLEDLDNWLYAELYPTTDETDLCYQVTLKHAEDAREEPVSSTPYTKKTRSRNASSSQLR